MRAFGVFCESFLDGFTMSGFMTRLRHTDEGVPLFASTSKTKEDWSIILERTGEGWKIVGGLQHIPESGLQAMIDLLRREDESRKLSAIVGHMIRGRDR